MMNIAYELCSQLVSFDESLFLLLNGIHDEMFDGFMWTVSGKWTWVPFYVVLTYMVMRKGWWKSGMLCLLFIAVTITFSDQTCASYIRPFVRRVRPSSLDNPISCYVHILNNYRGGSYGFPSCHAANTFALATFLSLYFHKRYVTIIMMLWATLVSYSRIYLGVHYPGDLMAGMIIGSFYACAFYYIYSYVGYRKFVLPRVEVKFRKVSLIRILRPVAVLLIMLRPASCHAQLDTVSSCGAMNIDTLQHLGTCSDDTVPIRHVSGKNIYSFRPVQLAVPGTLITIGIVGLHNKWFIHQNKSLREELQENIDSRFTIDDFTQYVPMAGAYALKLCGVRSKHGYGDMTIILGTAYALMGITVNALKVTTRIERPDGSSLNSFPSGHTATAFMGAELLRREYWDVSPWIGVAGYAVAAGTGFFRMYNNRHWLTDVIAGAGIGILSVQAAYWLYPVISKTFFRKNYLRNTYISPYLSKESKGVTCSIRF